MLHSKSEMGTLSGMEAARRTEALLIVLIKPFSLPRYIEHKAYLYLQGIIAYIIMPLNQDPLHLFGTLVSLKSPYIT